MKLILGIIIGVVLLGIGFLSGRSIASEDRFKKLYFFSNDFDNGITLIEDTRYKIMCYVARNKRGYGVGVSMQCFTKKSLGLN